MALFEDSEGSILMGHSALGALQEAASLEGAKSHATMNDLDRIESLNPTAMLDLKKEIYFLGVKISKQRHGVP